MSEPPLHLHEEADLMRETAAPLHGFRGGPPSITAGVPLDNLPPAAGSWVEARLQRLQREQGLTTNPTIVDLVRLVLCLGAQGEAILLGRGAGGILPPASTLNVRLVAPLEDRIAYMSQWLRLTEEEAAEQVRKRDLRRAEFLTTHFRRRPTDVYQYDLVLNSS